MGHRFGHDCAEMDHALFVMDAQLAAFLPRWLADGYEVIVTADHGQTDRGHHGGHDDEMQDFALYYFGKAKGPEPRYAARSIAACPDYPHPPRRTGAGNDEGQAVSGLRGRLRS